MSVCTPKSFDLTGKVALITGASYGIGFAIATAMANCGATIVFNDIKQELVDKGLAAYKEAGIEAHGYVCDVTNEDAVNEMVKKITAEVGHINVLVNNAGIIKRIPMIEMTAAQFRQVIDVDLNAPFIVAKAVIPDMIEQGGGKIINICSMMSELGRETVSAYAAAKGGLKMLTKNIASEYGKYNIQCNGIGPGYIATPQTAPLREIQPDGSRHPFDQFIVAKTPAERWGKAEDLGGPAVFLASEASDFRMSTFRLARRLRSQRAVDSMSDGQFAVLAGLSSHGPHTLGELAERERVSAPSMNRTVNCLEESGYLTRTPDDVDRRKVNIALTDAGRDVVAETVRRRDSWLEASLASLTPAQRAILHEAAAIMREVAAR